MKKYKKYKLEYVMFCHEQLTTNSRLFKDEIAMEEFLIELRKKENYVKSTKYQFDIIETEIK